MPHMGILAQAYNFSFKPHWLFVCWLLLYVLAASKVIPTCDRAHSWQLYSAASLGHQACSTMTCYPKQSHYPDTEPISPCTILIMSSARLVSGKYQFSSYWVDSTRVRTHRVGIRTRNIRITRSFSTGDGRSTHLATPSGTNHFDIGVSITC